jgi:outer membrane protein OmpA-like peptidoglycan-associated protein
MNKQPVFSVTLLALALAGCSTVPPTNAMLEQARSEFGIADADPQTHRLAGNELKQAGDALAKADVAFAHRDPPSAVDHLAYLAKQKVAIAEETARQKSAEAQVASASANRDSLRLAARTDEADAAQRAAGDAQRQADASRRRADASQLQAEVSRQQASEAQRRNDQLEDQLRDMNARKTDRGMVVTIGDVLFDTDKSQLKAGGMRNVEKLAGFFKQYPQRRALVEGFTDSTGSEGHNQELSGQRADAVRTALVDMGVDRDRIATHGYGESYPVAGNESSSGRQLNRRVEIVLSDESGVIAPR